MATGTSNDVHQQRHCHHHRIHCYIIITWITIVLYLYHHFRHHCHPCHLGETDLKYIGAEAELWKLILFATMLSLNCYTNTNKIQLEICTYKFNIGSSIVCYDTFPESELKYLPTSSESSSTQTSEKLVFGYDWLYTQSLWINFCIFMLTIQLTLNSLFWVHWQVFSGEMQRIAIKKMTPRIVLPFAKKSRKWKL